MDVQSVGVTGERFCAVYLPAFRVERLGFAPEEWVAVIAEEKNATRVVAASPAAMDEGVEVGMTITAARALLPELLSEPLDEAGEGADRAMLVEQFRRFSHRVGAWNAQTVVFEMGGSAHLFGGEEGLIDAIAEVVAMLGHLARVAVADDPVAAVALSRCAPNPMLIVPPGRGASALSELPIQALAPSPALLESLVTIGIERIGDYARLDAASVSGRYGLEGSTLLRIARGDGVSLGGWEQLDETEITEAVALGGPTATLEPILFLLPGLLSRMAERAAQRDEVVVRLALRFVLECGPVRLLRVRVGRPTRDVDVLMRLLKARLENVRVDAPVIELGVIFEETSGDPGWQPGLLDRATEAEALPELLARLEDALGEESVVGLVPCDAWRPESASLVQRPFARPDPKQGMARGKIDPVEVQDRVETGLAIPRPTLLLPRPRPIDVRTQADLRTPRQARLEGGWQLLVRVEGPERLEGDWWTDEAYAREYWVVETRSGATAWLFREDARWYHHGSFD